MNKDYPLKLPIIENIAERRGQAGEPWFPARMNTFDETYHKNKKATDLPPDFTPLNPERFDPDVWGPHYWFFLQTVAHTYPPTPNAVTKRKYYDFISNLPLFIPNPEIGDKFSEFLDKFPISPYLDSRDSFIRWVHFAHNKFNVDLGKREISLFEALDNYRDLYRNKSSIKVERFRIKKHYIYLALSLLGIFLAWTLF